MPLSTMMEKQVTKEGRLPLFSSTLNDEKIKRADAILEGLHKGENAAVTAFRAHMGARVGEAIHTTGDDFIHAFAQLTALQVVNEWEAAERNWQEVIPTESFASWTTPTTYTIGAEVAGFARPQTEPDKPAHIVPIVPEGSPYPSFTFTGEAAGQGEIHKAGGQYGLTFEKIVSDPAGIVPIIPRLITESLVEREDYDAWVGLLKFIRVPANKLAAGETADGVTTLVNAPLSREAVQVALQQAKQRKVNDRKVRVRTYDLLVPVGQKDIVEYMLNTVSLAGFDVTDTTTVRKYTLGTFNPFASLRAVVEVDYMTGTEWALVPSKNAIRGRDKFYVLGKLRGHEGPELRVSNLTGNYLGGGSVPPLEGSFDADSAAFRGRIIGGGLGWNSEYAVYSDGTGK